jgi:hypothetical protein
LILILPRQRGGPLNPPLSNRERLEKQTLYNSIIRKISSQALRCVC